MSPTVLYPLFEETVRGSVVGGSMDMWCPDDVRQAATFSNKKASALSPQPSSLIPPLSAFRLQASGLRPQASGLMILIITMFMIMITIMIMTMTMVSYHHHKAPRAVGGSVGGCSMDMWCPYGIGREIWDRVVRKLIDPDPSPLKGRSP